MFEVLLLSITGYNVSERAGIVPTAIIITSSYRLLHTTMVDASLQTLAYAVAYTCFGIGLSTVFLRVYCRYFLLQAWGSDDNVALFVGVGVRDNIERSFLTIYRQ